MKDLGLFEFRLFSGCLEAISRSLPLSFSARINNCGNVEFDFGSIPITNESSFILDHWHKDDPEIKGFCLSGKSADGIKFETENLHFESLSPEYSNKSGSYMKPLGVCLRGKFSFNQSEPKQKPSIRMHIKGFRNFGQLSARCGLGIVTMNGKRSFVGQNEISGYISVTAEADLIDLSVWRLDADKLLEHVRMVMSISSAAVLQVPIIECHIDSSLEVVVFSKTSQGLSPMPTFNYLVSIHGYN